MALHNEVEYENEICEHLAASGWLYSPNDDGYDRARALFPDDVLAWVTPRLNGTDTVFLPFNQGDHGAAGNPLNSNGGHRTAYLWEQVWERHSWLEILGRCLVAQKDDKKQIKTIIFPRYHQLDATRKLQAAVLAEGSLKILRAVDCTLAAG